MFIVPRAGTVSPVNVLRSFVSVITFIVYIVIRVALSPVSTSILITVFAFETFTVIGGHPVLRVFTL